MLKRIITGALLIVLVIGCFVLRELVDARLFNVLLYLCSFFGTLELVRAFGSDTTFLQKVVVIVFALVLFPAFVFLERRLTIVLCFTAVILLFVSLVLEFKTSSVEGVAKSLFALCYPNLFLIVIALSNQLVGTYGFIALLLTFVVAPFCDMFAYFVGSAIGGRKLSPEISPKKTVSGAIGGLIGGIVGAVAIWAFFKGSLIQTVWVEIVVYALIGAIGALLTIFGDLVEGAIKRKIGVKDLGNILPGHGGVLDRIDGIMFNGVFVYLALTLVLGII